jgi:hypothetical protein
MVRNACALLLYLLPVYTNNFFPSICRKALDKKICDRQRKNLLAHSNNKYKYLYLHHITKKGILNYNINQYFAQTEMQLSCFNKTIM